MGRAREDTMNAGSPAGINPRFIGLKPPRNMRMPACAREVTEMELIVGALLEVMDDEDVRPASQQDRLDEALAARCASL